MDAAWEQANERTGGGSDAGIRDDFFRKYYKDAKAYEEASKAYQDLLDKQGKYLEILNDPSWESLVVEIKVQNIPHLLKNQPSKPFTMHKKLA